MIYPYVRWKSASLKRNHTHKTLSYQSWRYQHQKHYVPFSPPLGDIIPSICHVLNSPRECLRLKINSVTFQYGLLGSNLASSSSTALISSPDGCSNTCSILETLKTFNEQVPCFWIYHHVRTVTPTQINIQFTTKGPKCICEQCRPRPAFISVHSVQGIHSRLM